MIHTTIIEAGELSDHLADRNWKIFDCRAELADKEKGHRAYLEAHIPGAVYVSIDDDLSGPPVTDHGRHPLPTRAAMTALFSRLGISADSQVVVYDDIGGAFAARMWWMLRYLGHQAVAVLDGGWNAWQAAGLPINSGEETTTPGNFRASADHDWLVLVDDVPDARLLVDARDPVRYRGDSEPLDRAAGHIPGAVNHFFKDNLDESGRFLDKETLRTRWSQTLGDVPVAEVVAYCGSGVTACHNVLALTHAGLGTPRLYAGSWSDWCSDPERPVATGEEV
jgi:thiosulfate/3-mercaptopyruvate sulfurtransferase